MVCSLFHARCASSNSATCSTGGGRVYEALVPEVVNVLDKGLDFASGGSQGRPRAPLLVTQHFISGESFAQDSHERPIAGEIHTIEFARFGYVLRCDIQSDRRFAGAGDTGDETDGFVTAGVRRADNMRHRLGRAGEVNGAGVAP